jgi:hypothetical protein
MKKISILFTLFCFMLSWGQIALPVFQGSNKSSLVAAYDFSFSPISGQARNNSGTMSSAISGALYETTYNALSMDGSNDYFKTNSSVSSHRPVVGNSKLQSFTNIVWVYPKESNGVILAELGQTTINSGYHYSQIELVGGVIKFAVWTPSGYSTSATITSASVVLNRWYMLSLTYDGSVLSAYIDGTLIGQKSGVVWDPPASGYYCLGCADSTNLGNGSYLNAYFKYFNIYNTALHQEDILALYSEKLVSLLSPSLVLDASNPASYNASTSQWHDLSGNDNHVSKTNLTWSSSSGGSYLFNNDPTDFYVPEIANSTVITVEMWVKVYSFNNSMFFGFHTYDVWTNGGNLGYNSGASDVYGISASTVNNLGILNNWKHIVFVMSSSNYTTNKIYVNGVAQTLTQILGSQNTNVVNFNNGNGRISGWRNSTSFSGMNYDISKFNIYPFEVTSASITEIYNQEKSKFGL